MRLGEALEGQNLKVAKISVGRKIREQVMSVFVPRAGRRTCIAAEHNLERRVRRIAGEILIGININASRMVDRKQPDLVEINNFFHRLHQAEAVACHLSSCIMPRSTLMYSVGRAMLRSPGATQCPTTPAPSKSPTSS